MALVTSSHFLHPLHISRSSSERALKRTKNTCAALCQADGVHEQIERDGGISGNGWNRRDLVFQAVLGLQAFPLVALAAGNDLPEKFRVYTDESNKFEINIPEDWLVGTGQGDGVKSVIAFYPPEASSSNVSIVITGLGADFTRLGSFGKVDAFAENLVGGLDRSWQRPPGVAAKLVDSKAANGLYYIEYTLKNPGESKRHLFTVLGISNNGLYNRLYTLTGQFVDEDEEKFSDMVRKAVFSFRLD